VAVLLRTWAPVPMSGERPEIYTATATTTTRARRGPSGAARRLRTQRRRPLDGRRRRWTRSAPMRAM